MTARGKSNLVCSRDATTCVLTSDKFDGLSGQQVKLVSPITKDINSKTSMCSANYKPLQPLIAIVFLTGYRPRQSSQEEKESPTHSKMPNGLFNQGRKKRQPNLIPATANVGFAKRLVLDAPPKVPGHRRSSSSSVLLLCPGGSSSRYHNILVAHVDGLRPCTRTRTRTCKVGPRTSHFAKIDNRNGSRSSILLALSAADRRVPPIVLFDTATTASAAAGSRAPLSDTMLLFELF
jgi:hypothetical protein